MHSARTAHEPAGDTDALLATPTAGDVSPDASPSPGTYAANPS
jgi:hypothetical protein